MSCIEQEGAEGNPYCWLLLLFFHFPFIFQCVVTKIRALRFSRLSILPFGFGFLCLIYWYLLLPRCCRRFSSDGGETRARLFSGQLGNLYSRVNQNSCKRVDTLLNKFSCKFSNRFIFCQCSFFDILWLFCLNFSNLSRSFWSQVYLLSSRLRSQQTYSSSQ